MRVIPDIVEGEFRLADTGPTARRVFLVTELAGASFARLASAAQAGGLPRVGEAHPVRGDMRVLDVTARAEGGDPGRALVDVQYGTPSTSGGGVGTGGVEISLQSDLITEETITDIEGNFIRTSYSFSVTLSSLPGGSQRSTSIKTHRVEVQRPTFSLIFQRQESRAPLALAQQFAGTVNTGMFQGLQRDRWLLNIESSQDGDGRHLVRYAFTLNRNGWQARVTHQENGLIPDDISQTTGRRIYQVYPRANFNRLGLPAV
jgi:hypothetical protein